MTRGFQLLFAIVLAFLGHAIAFVIAIGAAGLAIVVLSRGWRRVFNQWPLLVACLIPLRYLHVQAGVAQGREHWVMYNFDTGFQWAWNHLGDLSSSNGEEWAYAISFALLLLTLAMQPGHPDDAAANDSRRRTFFLWLCGFALFLGYGWGPAHMPNVAIICPRLLIFAWTLMFLLPLRIPRGGPGVAIAAAMGVAVLVHTGFAHKQYAAFNRREMTGFEALIRLIPPGQALIVDYTHTDSPYAKHHAMWHWPKLYGVWQGGAGRTNDSFTWRSTSFVTLTDNARGAETFFAAAPGAKPQALAAWDYYLVHGPLSPAATGAIATVTTAIGHAGEWQLFRIEKPKKNL